MDANTLHVAPSQQTTRWGQDRRLEFIDWRLMWDRRLNRADLTTFFGISIPAASLDIARYLELAPGNAVYDKSSRVYVAGPDFKPLYPGTSPERFLGDLLTRAGGEQADALSFTGWAPPIGVMPRPGRVVRPEVLLPLLRAIRERRALAIAYQSMSSPEPGRRDIAPHALAHDGLRWHLRAYCYRREAFRDFLLGRILDVVDSDKEGSDGSEDEGWQRLVPLELAPHPSLSAGQRRAIELDYGMTDGSVWLESRQALLFYVLRTLRLLSEEDERPEEQQLTLRNRSEVAVYLPSAAASR